MDFNTVAPYLPTPVLALKTVAENFSTRADLKEGALRRYNDAKNALLDTALAVVGFFAAAKFAGRVGLNTAQVAALTTVALPNVAKYAVSGYIVVEGAKAAFTAGKAKDMALLAKSATAAALAYIANTPKFAEYMRFAHSKI